MMLPDAAPTRVTGSPPDTATATKALLLLSPTGAGIHAVVHRIAELDLAPVKPCVRDSTRPLQPWDDETLRSFPKGTAAEPEFHERLRRSEYLAVMEDGYLYGIRKTDVIKTLRCGHIPVLRGLPGHTDPLKSYFATTHPEVGLVTVFMTTNPADAWKEVVRKRGFEVDNRIAASDKILRDLGLTDGVPTEAALKRRGIDRLVVNHWGNIDQTAQAIANLLR